MEGFLATARIKRPHGVKGYLRLESFSGETRHLLKLKKVLLEGESEKAQFAVEDSVMSGNSVLLKLEGVDSPEAGRRYSNWTVWVDRKKAAARKRKEYYAADLTGCVVTDHGERIGRVEAVCDTDASAYFEVRDLAGETFILPFSKRYFGKVDLKKKEIELNGSWLKK
jgi:16S rRNA processing protein RimM